MWKMIIPYFKEVALADYVSIAVSPLLFLALKLDTIL